MTAEGIGSPDPTGNAPIGNDPVPRVLCETGDLASLDSTPAGALWRLAEPGRQLDANVVRIPPGRSVAAHTERDLDVLVFVVAGEGTLTCPDGPRPLREGSLVWLPHGSARGLVAGPRGMSYLTVHPRRPGMRIQPTGTRQP